MVNKRVRRCCALSLSCVLVFSLLSGCDKNSAGGSSGSGSSSVSSEGGHLQIPLPEDSSLDFTLDNSDPQFGNKVNLGQTPDYRDQEVSASNGSEVEGQPEGEQGNGDAADGGGQNPPDGENQPAIPSKPPKELDTQLTKEPPTDDNKYPNTGMFLEDD